MKKEDVPQDNSCTYSGHKKVIYAVNQKGGYEKVESSGWEAEEFITLMAVNDLHQLTADAYQRVSCGASSALEYHMYSKRLDVVGLSQATGFFQWQIKRHLKPRVFTKLSNRALQKYGAALDLSCEELQTIPVHPPSMATK